MRQFGERLAAIVDAPIVIELCGDVGAGKTTLTKAIGRGVGIREEMQSPTFTISRAYKAAGARLVHYDFYRLHDAGVIAEELRESIATDDTIVVIEWSQIIEDVLPDDRIRIAIAPLSETVRSLDIVGMGPRSRKMVDQMV